jgi:hypothetical protein
MSRAIRIALPAGEVRALIARRGVSVRTIEPLPEGGAHVLCATRDGADEIRLTLADRIIAGPAGRLPLYGG